MAEAEGEPEEGRPIELAGDGLTLRGDAFGPASGPPVLLLHGGGQTRHSWKATACQLGGEGWRAIALDLRGHGESDWAPGGDYGPDAFARDWLRIVRELGRPPVVVGASLGGLTALLAEGELSPGGVFSALVLVDVTPRMERAGVERIIDFMTQRPDGFASLEEVADAVAAYNPHRERPRDLSGLEKNLRRGPDGRYRWHWDPAFLARRAERLELRRTAMAPERFLAAAGRLRVPTLLVRGGVSDVVSENGAREFLAAAPHARYVDVSGAGHMVAGDRNDAFTAAVVAFLAEARPSA